MRPGTQALISGSRVRGRRGPDREPAHGVRDDCTITTGTCACPPCTDAATDRVSSLSLYGEGEWVTGPHGIKTWRTR